MGTLGYNEADFDLETLYQDFLKLADKKGQVFDDDLEALLFNIQQHDTQEHYQIINVNVQSGSGEFATAGVKIRVGDSVQTQSATGNGPVDALYQAIKKTVDEDIQVADYKISNKGAGEDGLGVANLVVKWNERNFHGYGIATDVIEASGQAFVSALNAIERAKHIASLREERQQASK
jgi:2-isopropylmalate synthase